MKRILAVLVLALAGLAAALLYHVSRLPPPHVAGAKPPPFELDANAAAQRLSQAIRIPTVAYTEKEKNDLSQFAALAKLFESHYPLIHQKLKRENVGPSLLYTWPGSDPKAQPILLMAHMDVVPVEPGTEGKWTRPAFSGDIDGGYIWGRGTRDDKGSLLAQLEAIEYLLGKGYQPRRTVMLALGHDEEIGGRDGARKIAAVLESRKLLFEFALDEGGAITEGIASDVRSPVANIMIGEKGYVSFQLITREEGGHSSRPPKLTAIGRLARAVTQVQQHPFAARMTPPVVDMMRRLAPEMPFKKRLAIANLWLLESAVLKAMSASTTTDAMVRTTTAPTIIHAGIKDNVLPSEASAVINFRILPGESVGSVKDHIAEVINDEDVDIRLYGNVGDEPSPIADPQSESFKLIERVVQEQYPEAVISTGLVIGATDLRNYPGLYEHRYNFTPFRTRSEDLAAIHGTNERLPVDDYVRGIGFYARLIEEAAK